MNKVIMMGRLTKNPEIRYAEGENPVAVGWYTLAVNRRWKKEGESLSLIHILMTIKDIIDLLLLRIFLEMITIWINYE